MLKKRKPESKVKAIVSSLHVVPTQRTEKPPSYLYPLQKPAYIIPTSKSSREFGDSDNETNSPPTPPKEEEIKPKLVRPRNLDAHFKQILNERYLEEKDNDADQQFSNEEHFFKNDSVRYDRSMEKKKMHSTSSSKHVQRTKSAPTKEVDETENDHRYRYRESKSGYNNNNNNNSSEKMRKSRDSFDDDVKHEYSENLTDKQKYHQSLIKKQQNTHGNHREYYEDGFRPKEPPIRSELKSSHRNESHKLTKPYYDMDDRTIDSKKYRHKVKMPAPGYDDDFERNPYKEPEIKPYREKIECIKSPSMRYKSYDDSECHDNECNEECTSDCEKDFAPHSYPSKYRGMYEPKEHTSNRQRYRELKRCSPDLHDAPKERYHHSTNENFRQIDRYRQDIDRSYPMEKSSHSRRMMPMPRPDFDMIPPPPPPKNYPLRQSSVSVDWSSDEEFGRSSPSNVRIIPREHYEKNSATRMAPSKSLGNLAKGYRHSYAEPPQSRNPMPRNGGRVGLAAVQPY